MTWTMYTVYLKCILALNAEKNILSKVTRKHTNDLNKFKVSSLIIIELLNIKSKHAQHHSETCKYLQFKLNGSLCNLYGSPLEVGPWPTLNMFSNRMTI